MPVRRPSSLTCRDATCPDVCPGPLDGTGRCPAGRRRDLGRAVRRTRHPCRARPRWRMHRLLAGGRAPQGAARRPGAADRAQRQAPPLLPGRRAGLPLPVPGALLPRGPGAPAAHRDPGRRLLRAGDAPAVVAWQEVAGRLRTPAGGRQHQPLPVVRARVLLRPAPAGGRRPGHTGVRALAPGRPLLARLQPVGDRPGRGRPVPDGHRTRPRRPRASTTSWPSSCRRASSS